MGVAWADVIDTGRRRGQILFLTSESKNYAVAGRLDAGRRYR
jgi:hypothetical protein